MIEGVQCGMTPREVNLLIRLPRLVWEKGGLLSDLLDTRCSHAQLHYSFHSPTESQGPPRPTSAALAPTDIDALFLRLMPIGGPLRSPSLALLECQEEGFVPSLSFRNCSSSNSFVIRWEELAFCEQVYRAVICPRKTDSSNEYPSMTKLDRNPTAKPSPAPVVSMIRRFSRNRCKKSYPLLRANGTSPAPHPNNYDPPWMGL